MTQLPLSRLPLDTDRSPSPTATDTSTTDTSATDTSTDVLDLATREPAEEEVGTPDLVRLYLDEIGKAPLLDAATEVDLAQRIEAGLYARHLLAGLDTLHGRRAVKLQAARKVASSTELDQLAEDGELAKRAFIRANLRLVVSLARRYT
ncbi:MAG TPA: sigma-70 factor domain-containing protein, partial [Actinomycetes bacterium]|nr:sigma-70 factor domain-containing protein [Actinomycetes bacterium]